MPGVPSIYYGSEWGLEAKRTNNDDSPLRPCLDLSGLSAEAPSPDLVSLIARLAKLRHASPALKYGQYRPLFVAHEQFAFARQSEAECIVVAVNAASTPARLELPLPFPAARAVDLLDPDARFSVSHGNMIIDSVPPCGARLLRLVGENA
jgi:cyclomaltodextrinase / maltogenic alpha-amylase / neopullulanase